MAFISRYRAAGDVEAFAPKLTPDSDSAIGKGSRDAQTAAGLIPGLRRGQGGRIWEAVSFVPTDRPLHAIFYILETGCQWRAALPPGLPPRSTVHDYFICWQCARTLSKLHHEL